VEELYKAIIRRGLVAEGTAFARKGNCVAFSLPLKPRPLGAISTGLMCHLVVRVSWVEKRWVPPRFSGRQLWRSPWGKKV
jgi:hypothetical protein